MPPRSFEPHPLLRDHVEQFWLAERDFTSEQDTFTVLPDSMVELVFGFGAACTAQDDSGSYSLSRCYVVGLLDRPLLIRASGHLRTLGARLYPWAVLTLLRDLLPASARGSGVIAGLDQTLADEIERALATSPEQAVAALERFLIERVVSWGLGDPELGRAARRILAQRGDLDIAALASATGVSERTLRRKFSGLLGIGPKRLAQAARFQHVRDALWENPDASLADAALAAGYADQAHMQREFRRYSGRTPRQFAAEMRATRARFAAESGRKLQST